MYGAAEGASRLYDGRPRREATGLWLATKVWNERGRAGVRRLRAVAQLLARQAAGSSCQVHNISANVRRTLKTLRAWKDGPYRYLGVTHYSRSGKTRSSAICAIGANDSCS